VLLGAAAIALAPAGAGAGSGAGTAARLALSSPAFRAGGAVPRVHTCDGRDSSPPLRWTAPPRGARSLALHVYDVDASRFVHWIGWGIPARARGLRAGQRAPREGRNGFGGIGYGGPCPPAGRRHRYVFVLYALARRPALAPGSGEKAFATAVRAARVLAQARLVGTYRRR
jgi:Raf kinase inhibitor-like YbhB/YbcL family protein